MTVSDDTNSYFQVINSTTADGAFAPQFEGVQNTTSTRVPLAFAGTIGASGDSGTSPAILFFGRLAGGAPVSTRPLVEFRNLTTAAMKISGGYNLQYFGGSTSPALDGITADVVSTAGVDRATTGQAAAGNRMLGIQGEKGSAFYIGNDRIDSAASAYHLSIGSTDIARVNSSGLQINTAADPELRIAEASSTTSYLRLVDFTAGVGQIQKVAASGAATIDIDPIPSDGTSGGNYRIFRTTNTTVAGGCQIQIFKGDGSGTFQSVLSSNGDSYISAITGNLILGASTPGSGATFNFVLAGGTTSPVLGAATADKVHVAAVDNGVGNRELQIQPEAGKIFAFGNNVFRMPAGNSTSFAKAGGAIANSFADVTVGGAEADIFTYTTPASAFNTNGDKIAAVYGGNFVTVGTELTQLKVYFAGTAIWDSTGVAPATGTTSWRVNVELIRVSSTVVRYTVSLNTTGATGYVYCTVGELTGLTLSNTNILKITGTSTGVGSGSGDIVGKMSQVEWVSAA